SRPSAHLALFRPRAANSRPIFPKPEFAIWTGFLVTEANPPGTRRVFRSEVADSIRFVRAGTSPLQASLRSRSRRRRCRQHLPSRLSGSDLNERHGRELEMRGPPLAPTG